MKSYRIGFVLEQVLGHVTHSLNIQRLAVEDPDLQPYWLPVYYEMGPMEARLPVYNNNWSVRAGWKVRRSLQRLRASSAIDGLFIHTQVLGVLIPDWIRCFPTVVSMDATPLQYDELGSVYGHSQDSPRMEQFKFSMNQRMYNLASHLVTWTSWAKESLVADYQVPAEKITVIPPGVDVERFTSAAEDFQIQKDGPVKILFVGGDLKRKGGYLLLDAFRSLRETRPIGSLELHLVTRSDVPPEPGVFVHQDILPGDVRLIQHFSSADIFALPTDGDCLPMVLAEASASGLPSISTRVGGIPEIVIDRETGFLINPGDGQALIEGLTRLLEDADLRHRMGARARQLVCSQHNAAKNVPRLLELVKAQVDTRREVLVRKPSDRMNRA